jgi:hypothetical protein
MAFGLGGLKLPEIPQLSDLTGGNWLNPPQPPGSPTDMGNRLSGGKFFGPDRYGRDTLNFGGIPSITQLALLHLQSQQPISDNRDIGRQQQQGSIIGTLRRQRFNPITPITPNPLGS